MGEEKKSETCENKCYLLCIIETRPTGYSWSGPTHFLDSIKVEKKFWIKYEVLFYVRWIMNSSCAFVFVFFFFEFVTMFEYFFVKCPFDIIHFWRFLSCCDIKAIVFIANRYMEPNDYVLRVIHFHKINGNINIFLNNCDRYCLIIINIIIEYHNFMEIK